MHTPRNAMENHYNTGYLYMGQDLAAVTYSWDLIVIRKGRVFHWCLLIFFLEFIHNTVYMTTILCTYTCKYVQCTFWVLSLGCFLSAVGGLSSPIETWVKPCYSGWRILIDFMKPISTWKLLEPHAIGQNSHLQLALWHYNLFFPAFQHSHFSWHGNKASGIIQRAWALIYQHSRISSNVIGQIYILNHFSSKIYICILFFCCLNVRYSKG